MNRMETVSQIQKTKLSEKKIILNIIINIQFKNYLKNNTIIKSKTNYKNNF